MRGKRYIIYSDQVNIETGEKDVVKIVDSIKECAEYYGKSQRTINGYVKQGIIGVENVDFVIQEIKENPAKALNDKIEQLERLHKEEVSELLLKINKLERELSQRTGCKV